MATLFYSSFNQMFKSLFHSYDYYGIPELVIFVICSFILVMLTNFTAVPMGLFMPSMMIGAGIGRLYAEGIRMIFYKDTILDYNFINPGFYALVGSACMITSITRLMLTIIVIYYEITNKSTTCLPIMISI